MRTVPLPCGCPGAAATRCIRPRWAKQLLAPRSLMAPCGVFLRRGCFAYQTPHKHKLMWMRGLITSSLRKPFALGNLHLCLHLK